MILTAAFEFNPSHGKAIGLRATDDLYLSEVGVAACDDYSNENSLRSYSHCDENSLR